MTPRSAEARPGPPRRVGRAGGKDEGWPLRGAGTGAHRFTRAVRAVAVEGQTRLADQHGAQGPDGGDVHNGRPRAGRSGGCRRHSRGGSCRRGRPRATGCGHHNDHAEGQFCRPPRCGRSCEQPCLRLHRIDSLPSSSSHGRGEASTWPGARPHGDRPSVRHLLCPVLRPDRGICSRPIAPNRR
jgi:hypothetical protein